MKGMVKSVVSYMEAREDFIMRLVSYVEKVEARVQEINAYEQIVMEWEYCDMHIPTSEVTVQRFVDGDIEVTVSDDSISDGMTSCWRCIFREEYADMTINEVVDDMIKRSIIIKEEVDREEVLNLKNRIEYYGYDIVKKNT